MAAVTRNKAIFVSPPGYEVNDAGTLTEDVTAGDLLTNGATGWSKAAAGVAEAHGIALTDGYSGQANFDIGIHGEMDGFSGMTPGASLYPSGAVAGGLDTTQPAGAVTRVRASTDTRIRYSFV